MGFYVTKCRLSTVPCDCNLFVKDKEPLRGTRYNTRDEILRAIGRSIWNISKDGCADGVRRLPNIWQKVINKGATYIVGTQCYTLVNKAIIRNIELLLLYLSKPYIWMQCKKIVVAHYYQ